MEHAYGTLGMGGRRVTAYNIIEGTVVRFYTSTPFTNVSGTITDPTEVVFAYQIGSGPVQQTVYGVGQSWGNIVRDSTGTYHVDVDTSGLPGIWTYVWAGNGTVQARSEGQVVVSPFSVSVSF